jgi:hypothetical protein
MKARWALRALRIGLLVIAAAAVLSFIVMGLWNWLAPAVFGAQTITFLQALGILVLSRILFGGFRGRPGYGGYWRRRINDRWEQMTPEEREKFRQGVAARCGRASRAPSPVTRESGDPEGA